MSRLPKVIYKQKNPLGGDVYTDENNNIIGYGHKDARGNGVFLDKDFRYVGEKVKNLFGDPDKDRKEKESSGNTVYTDRDYSYKSRGGNSGGKDYVWLNRQPSGHGKTGAVIFLAVLIGGIALWLVLRQGR